MVSIIENEKDLENVVGGKIKAKHVVEIACGVVGVALLVVGGKFVYDVTRVGAADLVPVTDEDLKQTKKASKAEIIWNYAVARTVWFLGI